MTIDHKAAAEKAQRLIELTDDPDAQQVHAWEHYKLGGEAVLFARAYLALQQGVVGQKSAILALVPSGWVLDRMLTEYDGVWGKPTGYWCALEARPGPTTIEGRGPTPEQAVQNAAEKARRE